MTHPLDRRHMATLREMAADYQHSAVGAENCVERKHLAANYRKRWDACLFALRQIEPTEGQQQALDRIVKPMEQAT